VGDNVTACSRYLATTTREVQRPLLSLSELVHVVGVVYLHSAVNPCRLCDLLSKLEYLFDFSSRVIFVGVIWDMKSPLGCEVVTV